MNNQTNEKRDNVAAIGIGAMIVFIALILVAAVAAAVIIQTAEKLQQNAQAAGDDTQEQMSTKVVLLSTVISDMTGGAESLFVTFELAPGSNPVSADTVSYTVVCDDGGGVAAFDDGSFIDATDHEGDGDTDLSPADPITLQPGTTFVRVLDVPNCAPSANIDNVLIISVEGGGNTYEALQYGSAPAVGDVVV